MFLLYAEILDYVSRGATFFSDVVHYKGNENIFTTRYDVYTRAHIVPLYIYMYVRLL